MKNTTFSYALFLMFFVLFVGAGKEGYGQDKVRRYATRQESYGKGILGIIAPGTISKPEYAIDHNLATKSTLNVPLGLLNQSQMTQYLHFGSNIPANTAVTIKLSLPKSTLGIVDNFKIQPFKNLREEGALVKNWTADAQGAAFSGANLLTLLSGFGTTEVTIIPNVAFDGVWINLGSVVGISVSMEVYEVFIYENASSPIPCETRSAPLDVLSGVRGTAEVEIANATGSVINPFNAIDEDLNTYSLISTGAQILSEVFHTTIFNTDSRPNQVGKVTLQDPGGGLLSLNLLTGFTIQPYLKDKPVGTAINSSSVLNLRLLPGPSNIYELTFPVTGSFDRLEIKMGGVAKALSTLRVYEVARSFRAFLFPEADLVGKLTACETVDLTNAILNYDDVTYNYEFFNDPVVESAATTVTNLITSSGTYYIRVVDSSGCKSEKIAVIANVLPRPGKPHLTISDVIN